METTKTARNVEQVDTLMEREDVISDTIPASVLDGVTRFYECHGYRLQGWTLVSSGTYEATFTR